MKQRKPAMSNTGAINGETLRTLRNNRGWTQAHLAEKCGCRAEQINRWEGGRDITPRERYRDALTKSLGTDWDTLTRPLDDDRRGGDDLGKVQMNVRIDMKSRNAYTLMSLRYGIQPSELVGLAPLLFMIMAEKSLAWRSRNLETLDAALETVSSCVPHLSDELGIARGHGEWPSLNEEDSIRKRDIFGRHLQPEHSQPGSPFMAYLEFAARDLISDKLIGYVSSDYPGEADYFILATEDLRKATGLNGEHEDDWRILLHIRAGSISLDEVLERKRNLGQAEYLDWIHDHYKKLDAKWTRAMEDFVAELGK